MSALFIVQGVHIASGLALGVWPALLRLPASDARRVIRAIERPFGFAQMLFGTTVVAAGLLRAIWLGPIRSWADATGTEYGLTCLGAFALTVVLAVRGSRTGRFHEQLFDGEQFHPNARYRLLLAHALDILLLGGVIAAMVMLRYGL